MSRRRPGGSNPLYSVLTVAILAAVAGIFIYLVVSAENIDQLTGCSDAPGSRRYTFAFLIDTSDQFSPIQLQKVKNKVNQLVASTPQPDRIQIYTNTEEGELAEPIFDMCAPFENRSEAPALTRFRSNEFDQLIDRAFQFNFGRDQSPIIQSIDAVSLAMPRDNTEKMLMVVSDLYENSRIFNHYDPDWEGQGERNSRIMAATTPDLRNVNVHLLMIARSELDQGQRLIDWWVNYLMSAGASFNTTTVSKDGLSVQFALAERITGMNNLSRPRLVDRISSVSDSAIFALMFTIGAVSLVVLRLGFEANVILATLVPLATLVVYAGIVWSRPNRVREDRAADNLYYLGFLFTVVSLGIALYRYGNDAQGVNQIVSDLGIGLTTTIVGLFFRILFSQLRLDPMEIEEQARAELSASIEKFKTDVRNMGDVVRVSHTIIDQHIQESIERFDKVVDQSIRSIEQANQKIGELQLSPDLFKLNLETSEKKIDESVSEICKKIGSIEINFDEVAKKAAQGMENILGSLQLDVNALNQSLQTVSDLRETIVSAATTVDNSSVSLNRAIARQDGLEQKLAKLVENSFRIDTISNYLTNIEKTMKSIAGDVRRHSETYADTLGGVNESLTQSDAVIAKSNTDLARLVLNVHEIAVELAKTLKELKLDSGQYQVPEREGPYAEKEY